MKCQLKVIARDGGWELTGSSRAEFSLANEYLKGAASDGIEWKRYVQALLMSNEFYFVD